MNRRIRRRFKAKRDIVEQAVYMGLDRPATAERFLKAVDRTLELLRDNPRMGRIRADLASAGLRGLRSFAVPRFPRHLIFYRVTRYGIDVVRVLHGARDISAELGGEPDADE